MKGLDAEGNKRWSPETVAKVFDKYLGRVLENSADVDEAVAIRVKNHQSCACWAFAGQRGNEPQRLHR